MHIEIFGNSIIRIEVKPGTEARKVNLKKPITHTVSVPFESYFVTVYEKAIRVPQQCSILNGLIRFPFFPKTELIG